MSHSTSNSAPMPSRLRELRLDGRLGEALHRASEHLKSQPHDGPAMVEAIHILICMGEAGPASQLYQNLAAHPVPGLELEAPALVRLALQLGRADLLEGMAPPPAPSWLVTRLTGGEDPVSGLRVGEVDIRIEVGHAEFHFQGACPHCGHSLTQKVRGNLLVRREFICSACFGKVLLDRNLTREALERRHAAQMDGGLQDIDTRIIEQIRPKVTGQQPVPFIVKAMAQNYHFHLIEMALQAGPESTGGPEA